MVNMFFPEIYKLIFKIYWIIEKAKALYSVFLKYAVSSSLKLSLLYAATISCDSNHPFIMMPEIKHMQSILHFTKCQSVLPLRQLHKDILPPTLNHSHY